jgi:hypothetical protein
MLKLFGIDKLTLSVSIFDILLLYPDFFFAIFCWCNGGRIRNLRMGSLSWSVFPWQAFPALRNVTL